MSKIRTIRRILKGQDVIDGAGMKLIRTFANNDVEDFDPFLLLDIFDSVNPEEYVRGLDWHHHRGIHFPRYHPFYRLFAKAASAGTGMSPIP
jgi:redox-sensitive bicupin YhaK (pirin superfamily)